MFCRDTRFVKHEDLKIPLNGTEVKDNISRMRKSIVGAMNYRKEQNTTYLEKIKNFKMDINNSANYVFGQHKNYASYFSKPENYIYEINLVP